MPVDPPLIRCPACGSILVTPLDDRGMWECRYHLCRVTFLVHPVQEKGQMMLVAENEPEYGSKTKK